jgi:hypothetical protein
MTSLRRTCQWHWPALEVLLARCVPKENVSARPRAKATDTSTLMRLSTIRDHSARTDHACLQIRPVTIAGLRR